MTKNYEVIEHNESEFEHVILETKPATILPFPKNRNYEWLMRDIMSTPYGQVIR